MNYRTLYATVAQVGDAILNLALPTSSASGVISRELPHSIPNIQL